MLKASRAFCIALVTLAYAGVANAEVLTWNLSGQPFTFAGSFRYNTKSIEAVLLRLSYKKPLLWQEGFSLTQNIMCQGELVFAGPGTRTTNQCDLGLTGSITLEEVGQLDLSIGTNFAAEAFLQPSDWRLYGGAKLSRKLALGTLALYGNVRSEENGRPSATFGLRFTIKRP